MFFFSELGLGDNRIFEEMEDGVFNFYIVLIILFFLFLRFDEFCYLRVFLLLFEIRLD